MPRIRRSHTKEKPYMMINSHFFFFFFFFFCKIGKAKKSIGWAKCKIRDVCKWDMCWRSFWVFSLVTKKCENNPFFQMCAILKFDFQKRKQLHFSEENYLNYTKKTQFCMWHLHFPWNKGKQGEIRTSSGKTEVYYRHVISFIFWSWTSNLLLCIWWNTNFRMVLISLEITSALGDYFVAYHFPCVHYRFNKTDK